MNSWEDDFGREYTDRNPQSAVELNHLYQKLYGKTATEIYREFLADLPRGMRILEVGCNVGCQLEVLHDMGFKNLCGIDIQWDAVGIAQSNLCKVNVVQGDALDIPFKDGYFDMVFTAGLLIHIPPKDIHQAMSEIYRCSKKYILGFEYYAPEYTEIEYRGQKGMLWKGDFPRVFIENMGSGWLREVKQQKFKYLDNDNEDILYLMRLV